MVDDVPSHKSKVMVIKSTIWVEQTLIAFKRIRKILNMNKRNLNSIVEGIINI